MSTLQILVKLSLRTRRMTREYALVRESIHEYVLALVLVGFQRTCREYEYVLVRSDERVRTRTCGLTRVRVRTRYEYVLASAHLYLFAQVANAG